jgi:hypothetical protein
MRMHAQTAVIENGFAHIPETGPWLAEYLHEMTVFPNGKHDDQADSTAQFLDWFQKPFPGQGIYELYRRHAEAAEQRSKPQPAKTVWAPGSMEWQAEQNKSRGTAPAPALLSPHRNRAPGRQRTSWWRGTESSLGRSRWLYHAPAYERAERPRC